MEKGKDLLAIYYDCEEAAAIALRDAIMERWGHEPPTPKFDSDYAQRAYEIVKADIKNQEKPKTTDKEGDE